jgi:hypothetical protein
MPDTKTETPEHALNACLDELEGHSSLRLAPGARQAGFDAAILKFRDPGNEHDWPTFRERVLRAAALAGKIADLLERFEAEDSGTPVKEVSAKNVLLSLKLVKLVCDARRGIGPRFRWCPDQ